MPVGIADAYRWIDGDVIGMDGSIAGGNSTMRRLEVEDLNFVVLVNLGPDEGGIGRIRDEAVGMVLGSSKHQLTTGGELQRSSLVCGNQLIRQEKSAIFTDV